MTKVQKKLNIFCKKDFVEIIETAKLKYIDDISWFYKYETKDCIVDFYQNEIGKNKVEQFAIKIDSRWISLTPTAEQVKMMFDKLNATPYQAVEPKVIHTDEIDLYNHYGVQLANFS
jgi:hypothetical protein